MKVRMSTTLPSEWTKKRGVSYETRFLYIGFSRYDTAKNMLSKLTKTGDEIMYTETKEVPPTFSRGYYSEFVTVTVYSESPRMWMEEAGLGEQTFFKQV